VGDGAKGDDNKIHVEPLFQVKAFLKKKVEVVDALKEIESLKEQAKTLGKTPKTVIRSNCESGNMLEIALNDAHFGKLAWSRETGGPDYDTRITQKTFWTLLSIFSIEPRGTCLILFCSS